MDLSTAGYTVATIFTAYGTYRCMTEKDSPELRKNTMLLLVFTTASLAFGYYSSFDYPFPPPEEQCAFALSQVHLFEKSPNLKYFMEQPSSTARAIKQFYEMKKDCTNFLFWHVGHFRNGDKVITMLYPVLDKAPSSFWGMTPIEQTRFFFLNDTVIESFFFNFYDLAKGFS